MLEISFNVYLYSILIKLTELFMSKLTLIHLDFMENFVV